MQNKTALFVGRFQPLHKGHVHALEDLFRRFQKVIIIIGSKNKQNKENPFSFQTRKKMLELALEPYSGRYQIVGIPDQKTNQKWTEIVTSRLNFDLVVTGNPIVKKCLKDYPIEEPDFHHREKYNATDIRKAIRNDKNWKNLVPEEIIPLLEEKIEENGFLSCGI